MAKFARNFKSAEFMGDCFPVGGWVEPLPLEFSGGKDVITDESYKKIKDCGFDFVCSIYVTYPENRDIVLKHLAAAQSAGVKMIISDTDLQKGNVEDHTKLRENFDVYGSYASFGGWLVKDEPGSKSFNLLAKRFKLAERVSQEAIKYCNLLPTYSTLFMLKNGYWSNVAPIESCKPRTYDKYVKKYLSSVKPKFLSYDFYPFNAGESGTTVLKDYFLQLSIAVRRSKQANVPFIPFVQCCKFNKWSRNPTESELLWQANTSLCYGAKGLQYFTLWSPIDSEHENFSGCIIGAEGNIGERYYQVRTLNIWLKSVGKLLVNKNLIGVVQSGVSPAPIPKKDLVKVNFELQGDALMGVFENTEGKKFYYLVCNRISGKSKIHLIFGGYRTISVMNKNGISKLKTNLLSEEMQAGEGLLFTEGEYL